jgi:CheY-like chemotaxis protein
MKSDHSRNNPAFKILVVEDNPLDFELMAATLSSQFSCKVSQAMTKGEFERELAENQPDMIVSDSNVLAFDGFTALKIANERCPEVPFIFCSGCMSDDKLKDAPRQGVGWVSKDNGFAGLVDFVKKVLEEKEGTWGVFGLPGST